MAVQNPRRGEILRRAATVFCSAFLSTLATVAYGQDVCPVAPSAPSGSITITSPSSGAVFNSGASISVMVTASGFSVSQIVAQWAYGTVYDSASPWQVSLSTPPSAPGAGLYEKTLTIHVAALDSLGDSRQAAVSVLIKKDSDQDGTLDQFDKCPYLAYASQTDTDGDGIGNACQCGDVNGAGFLGDGYVNVSDILAMNNCIYTTGCGNTVDAPTLHADTTGDRKVTVADLVALNSAIYHTCFPVCGAYPTPPFDSPTWPNDSCGS